MARSKANYREYANHYEKIIAVCEDVKHRKLLKSVLKEIILPKIK